MDEASERVEFTLDEDGRAVINGPSELDVRSAEKFGSIIHNLVENDDVNTVIFNAERTMLLDSTGLVFLVNANRDCESLDKSFVLRNINPRAMRILEVTGLVNVFSIENQQE